jgi:PIN domain nuclease of toxin-antitoxin system
VKAILDTHALIWLDAEPAKLSPVVARYLGDPAWTCFLSVVNVWEILIKVGTGKLTLREDVRVIVADQLRRNPLQLLPVQYDHVLAVGGLPAAHKDPFDRLLVAQAIAENAVLLTDDPLVRQYPVRTDW